MPYYEFFWTDEIIAHLAEHDISPEDFERIVTQAKKIDSSRSSGRPTAFGYTEDGRYVAAVFEYVDEMTLVPVTAFEVPEPE